MRAIFIPMFATTVLTSRSHGGLHTAVRQKTPQNNVLGAILGQEKLQVCRFKAAETAFALDNQVTGGRFHALHKIRAPFSSREAAPFFDASKDSVRIFRDFVVTRFKVDGTVDDGAAGGSCLLHGGNRVFEHLGLVHTRLDGVVQLAAGAAKFVLVLDENKGRLGGVEGRKRSSFFTFRHFAGDHRSRKRWQRSDGRNDNKSASGGG